MAVVRVDFTKGKPETFAPKVAAVINSTMQEVLNVPPRENFVVCSEHAREMLLHHPEASPNARLQEIIFIQITLNQGRSQELKSEFFSRLTRELCAIAPLRPENVFINLVEVARENWAFGQPSV